VSIVAKPAPLTVIVAAATVVPAATIVPVAPVDPELPVVPPTPLVPLGPLAPVSALAAATPPEVMAASAVAATSSVVFVRIIRVPSLPHCSWPHPNYGMGRRTSRARANRENARVSRSLLIRSAILQTLLVGALSAVLALSLGNRFFAHWGWLVGPIAWLVLSLPPRRILVGAVLAGLPSIAAVAVGLHWLGDVVAIVLFALWCAWHGPRTAAW
jgi:hypothetical protein